jgi:hypothetical protein
MAVPGKWTLFYDWNTTGNYASTTMNLAANNTFTDGQGHSGTWIHGAGMLTFQFNNLKTTYSGNLADRSVTGISTTFGGLNGSFYMLEEGASRGVLQVAERSHAVADASGGR